MLLKLCLLSNVNACQGSGCKYEPHVILDSHSEDRQQQKASISGYQASALSSFRVLSAISRNFGEAHRPKTFIASAARNLTNASSSCKAVDANAIRYRMAKLGNTTVEETSGVYKVYVGPLSSRLEAQAMLGRVFAEGATNASVVLR